VANVARTQELQPDIDYHLDYQFDAWNSIPEYETQWPAMDLIDKEVFHLDWVGITESRLHQLEQWFHEGHFTTRQRARYHDLLQLITRYRPTIDHLLSI
jgi:hypothetical protein